MPELAERLDAIPLVATTAARGTKFPSPATGQRVQNLETRAIERYTGTGWVGSDFAGVFSVKSYGAVGDGATDDTVAIQAAIDAAEDAGGGIAYLPAGSYRITDSLLLRSNVKLLGDGIGITTLTGTMATTTDPAVYGQTVTGTVVEGLTIAGTHAWGILISGGSDHQIRRCAITGGVSRDSSGSKGGGMFVENTTQVIIDDNTFSGNGVADGTSWYDLLFNFGTYAVTNSRVTNNRLLSTTVDINFAAFDCRRLLIEGNLVTGADTPSSTPTTGGYGIAIYRNSGFSVSDAGECVIRGNHVYGVDGTGIYVQSMRDCVVVDNLVEDTCSVQTDTSLTVAGIGIHDSGGCTVTGNKVLDSGQAGIGVTTSGTDANRCVISGNQIENVSKIGISIRGIVTDCAITGNTIINCVRDGIGSWSDLAATRISVIGNVIRTITGGGYRGIYAAASATSWTIRGNTMSDLSGGGAAISAAGSTHIIDGFIGTATYDAANLVDGAGATTTVTVTGAALGDLVKVSFSLDLQGITTTAYVSAANTVSVRLQNETGGSIDLASGTLTAFVTRNC